MKIKFFIHLIIFIIILYAIQIVFNYFYPYEIPKSASILKQYSKNDVDIIYFGDSTLTFTSIKDEDKRSTPEILAEYIGSKHKVGMDASPAWNPDVYYQYSKYLVQENYYPKYLIIPVNLRNFSIASDLYPTYQFVDDFVYINYHNTILSPFLSFLDNLITADIDQKYEVLYKYSTVYNGDKPVGKAEYFETMPASMPYLTRFKNLITFYYMANVKDTHRKFVSLINIAKLFKDTRTKVIFYVTPVDYQTAEKFYPGEFKKRIKANVNLISSKLKKEGASVIDLSFALKTEDFNWAENQESHRYIDEHINNSGKKSIAKKLLDVINLQDKK